MPEAKANNIPTVTGKQIPTEIIHNMCSFKCGHSELPKYGRLSSVCNSNAAGKENHWPTLKNDSCGDGRFS